MIRRLERLQRILGTGSAFLFFFFGGMLLSYLILPLARLRGGTEEEKARRCRSLLGRSWIVFHDYMRGLRLIDFNSRHTGLQLPREPCVLVANHPTLIDVTAILSSHHDAVAVSKTAMFRSPLVGRILRYCDHVEGGDGSIFSGAAVVDGAVARLAAGVSVLIFPEGTRSPEHGLGEFHVGAVQIAARAGVPLIPLLVTCEPPTLMRGQPWYEVPVRTAVLRVQALPAIHLPREIRPREEARRLRQLFAARLAGETGGDAPTSAPVEEIAKVGT